MGVVDAWWCVVQGMRGVLYVVYDTKKSGVETETDRDLMKRSGFGQVVNRGVEGLLGGGGLFLMPRIRPEHRRPRQMTQMTQPKPGCEARCACAACARSQPAAHDLPLPKTKVFTLSHFLRPSNFDHYPPPLQ